MPGVNWMDGLIFLGLLVGLLIGYRQGLLRQVIGLAALYIASILAIQYFRPIADTLRQQMRTTPGTFLQTVVFMAILVFIMVLINGLAYDAYKTTKVRLFPILDRTGGSLVGAFNASIFILVLLMPLSYTVNAEAWSTMDGLRGFIEQGLNGSTLARLLADMTPTFMTAIRPWLPAGLPSIFAL